MAGANPIDGTYYLYLPRYAVTYNLNLTGATSEHNARTFSVLDSVTLALLNAGRTTRPINSSEIGR